MSLPCPPPFPSSSYSFVYILYIYLILSFTIIHSSFFFFIIFHHITTIFFFIIYFILLIAAIPFHLSDVTVFLKRVKVTFQKTINACICACDNVRNKKGDFSICRLLNNNINKKNVEFNVWIKYNIVRISAG